MKINVIAHPNSKNPRVEIDLLDNVHVYINAPPLEGKANRALVEALAGFYKVSKSQVIMLGGGRSKNKFFEIVGI